MCIHNTVVAKRMATRTATRIHAKQALLPAGWQDDVLVDIDNAGRIEAVSFGRKDASHTVDALLPSLSNLHSHSFQRAIAGMAETRGGSGKDDFWSWRSTMYRFLELLTPDDIESIAALVYMEMLESGFAACGEFHYIHKDLDGKRYADEREMSSRIIHAAQSTGIGLTHLPVLYQRGGLDDRPLQGGQTRFGTSLDEFQSLFSGLESAISSAPPDFALGVAPHSLRAVDQAGLELVQQLCPTVPIHIHIAEQTAEVEEVQRHLGTTPVAWLLENAEVDHRWCFVHATHMTSVETADLAKSGAVAGLCPITEANLGDGIFNASDFLIAGGQFGIGSDSNVLISLAEELRLLEYSQRLSQQRRLVFSDAACPSNGRFIYEGAAQGGAQALGRTSGAIKPGHWADLVALNQSDVTTYGKQGDALLDSWLFAARNPAVSDVWSAGRHVVSGGQHIDHDQISQNFKVTLKRLQAQL